MTFIQTRYQNQPKHISADHSNRMVRKVRHTAYINTPRLEGDLLHIYYPPPISTYHKYFHLYSNL